MTSCLHLEKKGLVNWDWYFCERMDANKVCEKDTKRKDWRYNNKQMHAQTYKKVYVTLFKCLFVCLFTVCTLTLFGDELGTFALV